MKTNKYIFALLTFFAIMLLPAQNSLNDYKYVIVPNQFEFQREVDQYRLNSLSKFLFEKNGFIALKEGDALPKELVENGCLSLNADVLNNSGLFKTKLKIQLKNCRGEVMYTSEVGTSRAKKFVVAYNEALRAAFKHMGALNYKYLPNDKITGLTSLNVEGGEKDEEIEKLKKEIQSLKEKKEEVVEVVKEDKEVLEEEGVEQQQPKIRKEATKVLYAQPTNNGYQLVDTTPKVIHTIYASGKKDIYMVKGIDALIYKIDGVWTIAEQKEKGLEVKTLNIKF